MLMTTQINETLKMSMTNCSRCALYLIYQGSSIKVQKEQCRSNDEQITLAKTKRSGGAKQKSPKKVHKLGFKNMVRTGQSRMIYSFLCMAENIVQVQHDVVLKNLFYVLSKNSPNIKNFLYILITGSQRFHF